MAESYDGGIRISTELDSGGFKKGSKEILSAINGLRKSVEDMGASLSQSLQALSGAYARTGHVARASTRSMATSASEVTDEVADLYKTLNRVNASLEKTRVASYLAMNGGEKEAAAYARQSAKTGAEIDALYERLEELQELDVPLAGKIDGLNQQILEAQEETDRLYKQWQEHQAAGADEYTLYVDEEMFNEARARLVALQAELAELEASGETTQPFGDTAEYAELNAALEQTAEEFDSVRAEEEEASVAGERFREVLSGIARTAVGVLKAGLQAVGKAVKGVWEHMKKMVTHGGKGTNMLKTMIRAGLGIRSIYQLFRKALAIIKEGFANMAQYSDEFNGAMSSMKNALTQLKYQLGAAFAPIVQAAAPAIVYLINLLYSAVAAISAFMAAITGRGTYTKAKAVTDDYAASLKSAGGAAGGAAKEAKELKRQLAGFDELEILKSEDDKSGGGGGGGGKTGADLYEEAAVESGIADFANTLRQKFSEGDYSGIGEVIAEKLNGQLEKAKELVKWENLGEKLTPVLEGIVGAVNGLVEGVNWTALGETGGEGVNTIIHSLNIILEGIEWDAIGEGLADSLNGLYDTIDWPEVGNTISNIVTTIQDLVNGFLENVKWRSMGKDLVQMVKNIKFREIASKLFEGLGAVLGALGGFIVGVFEDAWKAVKEWWTDLKAGEFTWEGFLAGIKKGVKNIGTWIKTNIFDPFVKGFKKAFGIASPAKAMEGPGKDVLLGVLQGILNAMSNISAWVKENIWQPIVRAFEKLKATLSVGIELVKYGWTTITDWVGTAQDKLVTVSVALQKAKTWVADAWTAAKMQAGTVVRTVQSSLQKAKTWVTDAWTAACMSNGTVTKTVQSVVKQAATWIADAWTAAKMGNETVTKTVQSVVKRAATWVADAWSAASMSNGAVTRTVQSVVKQAATWVADAWTAAKMTGTTIFRTIKSVVKKGGTWIDEAWDAAQSVSKTIKTTLEVTVRWLGQSLDAAWKAITGRAEGGVFATGSSNWKSIGASSTARVTYTPGVANTRLKHRLQMANGGVVQNGVVRSFLSSIPHYAAGGGVHGSLFLAGEAGPEVVGHVGGRTEVLNQSQLAGAMYGAVASALAQVLGSLVRAISGQLVECTNAIIRSVVFLNDGPLSGIYSNVAAINSSVRYVVPAVAAGALAPYSVTPSSFSELSSSIEQSNSAQTAELVSAMMTAAGLIVAAVNDKDSSVSIDWRTLANGVIKEINRRTVANNKPVLR